MSDFDRREFIKACSVVGAAVAPVGALTIGANPVQAAPGYLFNQHKNLAPAVQAAWESYLSYLEQARAHVYSYQFSDRPEVQLAAHEIVMQAQALAYNMAVAPHVDYPRFFVHTVNDPGVYTAWLWNPDFRYRWCWVDGRKTYRVWGKKGTTRYCSFDIIRGSDYDQASKPSSADSIIKYIEDFADSKTGEFDFRIGNVDDGPRSVRLPQLPEVLILVREALWDWENDATAAIHIELDSGSPRAPLLRGEAEIIRRIERAGRFVLWTVKQFGTMIANLPLIDNGGKLNQFGWQHSASQGGHRAASYADAVYELRDDEALLFEFKNPSPNAHYWGVQLGSVFMHTTDYVFHQSSLNGFQTQVDADGVIRMVLSKRDPGVPNWLDVVDYPLGFIQFRRYAMTDPALVDLPKAKVIKVGDVRKHLPAATPVVSIEQRAAQLQRRARAMLAQYGY